MAEAAPDLFSEVSKKEKQNKYGLTAEMIQEIADTLNDPLPTPVRNLISWLSEELHRVGDEDVALQPYLDEVTRQFSGRRFFISNANLTTYLTETLRLHPFLTKFAIHKLENDMADFFESYMSISVSVCDIIDAERQEDSFIKKNSDRLVYEIFNRTTFPILERNKRPQVAVDPDSEKDFTLTGGRLALDKLYESIQSVYSVSHEKAKVLVEDLPLLIEVFRHSSEIAEVRDSIALLVDEGGISKLRAVQAIPTEAVEQFAEAYSIRRRDKQIEEQIAKNWEEYMSFRGNAVNCKSSSLGARIGQYLDDISGNQRAVLIQHYNQILGLIRAYDAKHPEKAASISSQDFVRTRAFHRREKLLIYRDDRRKGHIEAVFIPAPKE